MIGIKKSASGFKAFLVLEDREVAWPSSSIGMPLDCKKLQARTIPSSQLVWGFPEFDLVPVLPAVKEQGLEAITDRQHCCWNHSQFLKSRRSLRTPWDLMTWSCHFNYLLAQDSLQIQSFRQQFERNPTCCSQPSLPIDSWSSHQIGYHIHAWHHLISD